MGDLPPQEEPETLSCTGSAADTRRDSAAGGRMDRSPKKPQPQDLRFRLYPRLRLPQDNREHSCPQHQSSQHLTSNSSSPGRQEHREMTSERKEQEAWGWCRRWEQQAGLSDDFGQHVERPNGKEGSQIANFSHEMEIPISIAYNWNAFLKNTTSERRSFVYNLISKLNTIEERVSEVEVK